MADKMFIAGNKEDDNFTLIDTAGNSLKVGSASGSSSAVDTVLGKGYAEFQCANGARADTVTDPTVAAKVNEVMGSLKARGEDWSKRASGPEKAMRAMSGLGVLLFGGVMRVPGQGPSELAPVCDALKGVRSSEGPRPAELGSPTKKAARLPVLEAAANTASAFGAMFSDTFGMPEATPRAAAPVTDTIRKGGPSR